MNEVWFSFYQDGFSNTRGRLVLKLRLDSFPFSYVLTIAFIKEQNVILKFVSHAKYSNLRFPL